MEQVLILLVISAGVAHAFFTAAETNCNATHGTPRCTVTRGGSVQIQVMTNASGYMLRCKKQLSTVSTNVFSLKKGKVTIQEEFRTRTEFFIHNGTLKITEVERNDSGPYTVEVFEQNGFLVRSINVFLDVQERNLPIWIPVCSAAGALLIIVLICCCVCRRVRRRKKSGSGT